jgi:hypothetical protein
LQSPTLLNKLAKSSHWQLEVADLGDASLAEAELLTVPRYDAGEPHLVVVATPEHLRRARERWPRAKHVWAVHNARPSMIAPEGEGLPVLAFSRRVAGLQRHMRPSLRIDSVRPFYEAKPIWSWKPGSVWMMLSRPETRHPTHLVFNETVCTWAGVTPTVFGEGQPGGFLRDPTVVMRECSAYLSSLPFWAGFGLAQHECFAAGVPLVCSRWGDTPEEIPLAYSCLVDDLFEQAQALRLIASPEGKPFAEQMSQLGLQYIADHRTLPSMEEDIERFLDGHD